MNKSEIDDIHSAVRTHYGQVAEKNGVGCATATGCCAGETPEVDARSRELGYSDSELDAVPAGANLGLGCGNPQALAELQPGEVVLDLGSGAGFDSFLAARLVGDTGRVIGVDMTPEMLAKARANARNSDSNNVEFRLGEIESLPIADATVDVVISNCVINLSPDKRRVFMEAYRVLKAGGRVAISDVIRIAPMPRDVAGDMAQYTGCVAGAASAQEITDLLRESGFSEIRITSKHDSRKFIGEWVPGVDASQYLLSAFISAVKAKT